MNDDAAFDDLEDEDDPGGEVEFNGDGAYPNVPSADEDAPTKKGLTMAADPEVLAIDDTNLVEIIRTEIANATGGITKSLETLTKAVQAQTEQAELVKGFMDELSRGGAAKPSDTPVTNAGVLRKNLNATNVDFNEPVPGIDPSIDTEKAAALLNKAMELQEQGKDVDITYDEFRDAYDGRRFPGPERLSSLESQVAAAQ